MKNLRLLISFTCCLFFALDCFSQYSVTGTLQEPDGSKLSYASVLLLNSSDSTLAKGQISDASGEFLITTSQGGNYLLSVSSIGYSKYYTSIFDLTNSHPDQEFGRIEVEKEAQQLGEVVVEAERPLFEQKIDRTIINVENNITAAGGSALDVLQRSPGVTVDRMNNSIALSGKQGVRVMINGKISRMPMAAVVQMLNGMNAENIEKIELITTPPAKYEAEGDAGMINIVVKKKADAGTNGTLSLFTGYGRRGKYGGNINLNHRKNKVNIYGDYGLRNNYTRQIWDANRTVQIEGDPVHTTSANLRDALTRIHDGRVGLDWDVSDKTTIGGLVTYFNRHWDMDAVTDITQQIGTAALTTVDMHTVELNDWDLLVGNINFSHNISENKSLSVDIDHISYDSSNPTNYFQDFFDSGRTLTRQGQLRSAKQTPIKTWVGKIDYSGAINESINMEMGVKGSFSHLQNQITVENLENSNWLQDDALTSDANMQENIRAAYVSTTIKATSSLNLQFGLRYEHTRTDLDTQTEQNVVDRSFGNWFPSVFFNKTINKDMSYVLSYSRRVSRPSFFQLAPFVIFSDPNSFFSGNVSLLPSLTDAVKAEYRYKSTLISLQYSHDQNAISVFQPQINEENQQVSTAQNMDFRKNYGLTISFPVQVTKWWEMQFNVLANRFTLQASYLSTPVQFSVNALGINGSQKITLPNKWNLEISGFYQTKQLFGVSEFLAYGSLNFGIEKKLKNGSIRLSANDVLATNTWIWNTDIPQENLKTRELLDFETQVVRLAYTWNFGNNKLKAKRNRQTGSSEEQQRFQN